METEVVRKTEVTAAKLLKFCICSTIVDTYDYIRKHFGSLQHLVDAVAHL